MTKFALWQQLPPVSLDNEWHARLVRCGTVYAMDADDALDKAYNLESFRRATGGARYPVVEAI